MLSQIKTIGVYLMIIIVLCRIDGQNDINSRADKMNKGGDEKDFPKCRHLTTNNSSYVFYPIEEIQNEGGFFLKFNVKGEREINIIFSPTNQFTDRDQKALKVLMHVEPDNPSKNDDEPVYPSDIGDEPDDPEEVNDEPANPSKVNDEPDNPSKVGDEPDYPSDIGNEPDDPEEINDEPGNPSKVSGISKIQATESRKPAEHVHYEKNMVSSKEWRQFWIRITSDGTSIEVGKNGSAPFMSSRVEPRQIKYYGFASSSDPVRYAFLCFENSNVDNQRYRTLITYDNAYTFYPIRDIKNDEGIFLKFNVKTDQDAIIIFSHTNETVKNDEKVFIVILGGYTTNTISAIKTSELDGPGSEYREKDILSPDEWRQLWIRITPDGASIQVGKNGGSAFMSLKTESTPIKYYGFASGDSFASWTFPSLENNNIARNVCMPSPCGPNSECKQKDNHAICSCRRNELGSPSTCRLECIFNSECPQTEACIEKTCKNPCNVDGTCGENTSCKVDNHVPICSCSNGTTGDPLAECVREEDLPKYRSISSHGGAHIFYPIGAIKNENDIFLKFNVKTPRTAVITFSSTNQQEMDHQQFFKVSLDGPSGALATIHSHLTDQFCIYNETDNLLSVDDWRQFWIRITSDGSSIEVGKNGKPAFMSVKVQPWPIKYFGFTSKKEIYHVWWNFVCSKNINTDLLRYRTQMSTSGSYAFYPIKEIKNDDGIFLTFDVKIDNGAMIRFTTKNYVTYEADEIIFDVVLGVREGSYATIRNISYGKPQSIHDEKNIVSGEEWRKFWIRIAIDGSSIEVGKNRGPAFMSLKTKPSLIKYFGFYKDSSGGSQWAFPSPPSKANFLVFI
ncbi:uncharacterized protein LOC135848019 [Planococcus citri]|uniref:uncharacterized protein LOC135848019 n=1 Tax=Planococcus citri TaxID=170843 RepID=UPI0031F778D1